MSETQATQLTQIVKSTFRFRKDKEGFQRPTVEVDHPAPTIAGLIHYLQSDQEAHKKVQELLVDLATTAISQQLRSKVDANTEFDQVAADALVEDGELTLEFIANMPKRERNVISKDDLEAFAKLYVQVMVTRGGLEQKRAENAGSLMAQRFNPVRGDVQLLQGLQGRLGEFMEHANEEEVGEFQATIEYLVSRLDDLTSDNITADAI